MPQPIDGHPPPSHHIEKAPGRDDLKEVKAPRISDAASQKALVAIGEKKEVPSKAIILKKRVRVPKEALESIKQVEAQVEKMHLYNEVRPGLVKEMQAVLEKNLEHAFRKGINVGVQGLLRQAPSDHLPVEVSFNGISAASWNLLADAHLYNNLRNVSGTSLIQERLPDSNGYKERMHWFFSDLGSYLLEQRGGEGKLMVDQNMLDGFIAYEEGKLNKSLAALQEARDSSRTDTEREEVRNKIESEKKKFSDLSEIVNLMKNCDDDEMLADSVPFTLRHTVEIMHGIKEGYLRWDERKKLIMENAPLLETLAQKEILCFQECTKPSEMLEILRSAAPKGTNLQMLKHRVPKRGEKPSEKRMTDEKEEEPGDWCVIIYDANKFSCAEYRSFGLARNTKPCILAKLVSIKDPSKVSIIGSVHLPGGKHSDFKRVLQKVEAFAGSIEYNKENIDTENIKADTAEAPSPSVCIMGDFNHKQSFFSGILSKAGKSGKPTSTSFTTPAEGTMAGPDFGNTNKAIDGALTRGPGKVSLSTIKKGIRPAAPIHPPFEIEVDLRKPTET